MKNDLDNHSHYAYFRLARAHQTQMARRRFLMWDVIITLAVVVAAAAYFLRRMGRNLTSKTPTCCEGCSGSCGGAQRTIKTKGGDCHG